MRLAFDRRITLDLKGAKALLDELHAQYHEGHERRIEGFATKNEAVDWITANTTQLDK